MWAYIKKAQENVYQAANTNAMQLQINMLVSYQFIIIKVPESYTSEWARRTRLRYTENPATDRTKIKERYTLIHAANADNATVWAEPNTGQGVCCIPCMK